MKNTIYLITLILILMSCGGKKEEEVPSAKVKKGMLYIDLYEEGEVQAVNSKLICAPNVSYRYGNLKVDWLIKDGTKVQAGDTVVRFDPTEVRKSILNSKDQLEIKYAELEKMKAQHSSNIEGMESDYEVAKLSLDISEIEYEAANYEADIKKKEIKLNLEKAKIALDQAKLKIENTKKIQKEELSQKLIDIQQAKDDLTEDEETLNKLYVVTESPGITIIKKNRFTDLKFQEGDQTWAGFPMIELPDLSDMKAEVMINEVDIAKIKVGQEVEIKPDAFSSSSYTGKIATVAKLAINKEKSTKVKVFPVTIHIETGSDSTELMPGLTVSCRIIIDKIPDVLFIPLESVFKKDGKDIVYVKKSSGYKEKEVDLGISNTDYVIVKEGLGEKDEVALADPTVLEKSKNKSEKEE